MSIYAITFPKKFNYDGFSVILRAGPGTFGPRNTFYVTEEALKALDKAEVPYRARSNNETIIRKFNREPRLRLRL